MKKLNKKGFTLVELLAVIVILAVIMVITIPTVLGSMSDATDSAFNSAVTAIQKYIDDQTELCNAGLGNLADYNKDIFMSGTCVINDQKTSDIVKAAGYEDKITITMKTECRALQEGETADCPISGSGNNDGKMVRYNDIKTANGVDDSQFDGKSKTY